MYVCRNGLGARTIGTAITTHLIVIDPNSMGRQQIVTQELNFIQVSNCSMINFSFIHHFQVLIGDLCNMLKCT